jgi:hypothetical protein
MKKCSSKHCTNKIQDHFETCSMGCGYNEELAQKLYDTIKHGDEEHKEWLANKLEIFFKTKSKIER